MAYKKILVAVDLGETSTGVLEKAHEVALGHSATLHVLHAVEPLSITYGGDIPMDFSSIQNEIYDFNSKETMIAEIKKVQAS